MADVFSDDEMSELNSVKDSGEPQQQNQDDLEDDQEEEVNQNMSLADRLKNKDISGYVPSSKKEDINNNLDDDLDINDDNNNNLDDLDNLEDLSELSDNDEDFQQKKKPKQEFRQNFDGAGSDSDDGDNNGNVDYYDSDDQDGEYGKASKRKRSSKKGEKTRKKVKGEYQETGGEQQAKMSKQESMDAQLQVSADEISSKTINKMKIAKDKDEIAKQQKRPAIYKLLCMNDVFKALKNSYVKSSFAEEEGLEVLHEWMIRSQKDNSISLRKKILDLLLLLQIRDTEVLQTSLIVKHCQEQRQRIQHQRVPYDKETQRKYIEVVDSWAPILSKKTLYAQEDEQY